MEKITTSAGRMYLSRDDEAPMLYAVWLDGDILGAGDTAAAAIAEARATLLGWKRAQAAEQGDDPEETCAHVWVHTGTAYGGDDDRFHGEGRVYCAECGADGDA